MPPSPSNANSPQVTPLVPFSLIDAPSQRFYIVSLAAAVQAWKYTRIIRSFLFSSPSPPSYQNETSPTSTLSLSNAILINFVVLFILSRMGIPKLDPRLAAAQSQPSSSHQQVPGITAKTSRRKALTYTSYLALFVGLSIVDAIFLGSGWSSPAYLVFSLLSVCLRFVSSLVGVNLSLDILSPQGFAQQLGINEGRVRIRDLIQPNSHILGQHTIHILPYSTAKLTPDSACYCIDHHSSSVSIPVFFNNTEPDLLQYSVTDFATGQPTLFNVSITGLVPLASSKPDLDADELRAVSAAFKSQGSTTDQETLESSEDNLDEPLAVFKGISYTERARIRAQQQHRSKSSNFKSASISRPARPTQFVWHLPVHNVGRVRLERVLDKDRNDARLSSTEALVVECPSTSFIDTGSPNLLDPENRCPADEVELNVQVRGLLPLELEYRRIFSPITTNRAAWDPRGRNANVEEQVQTISRISSPHHSSPLLLPEVSVLLSPLDRLALAYEQTKAAAAHSDTNRQDYSWAAADQVNLPLNLPLERAGNYTYVLESIRDACGNTVQPSAQATLPAGMKAKKRIKYSSHQPKPIVSRQFHVHPRATAAFDRKLCYPGHPLKLLRTKSSLNLSIETSGAASDSDPWNVAVVFEPDNTLAAEGALARKSANPWKKTVSVPSGAGSVQFQAEAPGSYRIEDVTGKFCPGHVGAPWVCEVVDVAPPTAQISFSSIEDQCAGPVGVKALSVLTGTPPFKLEYEIFKQGQAPVRHVRRIQSQTRDELEFRPSTEGVVTYKFLKLQDANYNNMVLDGPTFTQIVHPLATARFADQHNRENSRLAVVHSCDDRLAKAKVEFGGTGPWDLTYSIRGAGISETKEIKQIVNNQHILDIELPPAISHSGGRVTVSLVSIRDAKGCERPLATSDLNIEVRKTKPSVGFLPAQHQGQRQVELLDGKQARLPLRLNGEGPWTVEYSYKENENSSETVQHAKLLDLSGHIVVNRPGLYVIKSVQDAYCPGKVLDGQDGYVVFVRTRPSVRFSGDAGTLAKNGSIVRSSVCQGQVDSVDVEMKGSFPIDISFEHQASSWAAPPDTDGNPLVNSVDLPSNGKRRKASFSSAQSVSNLELSTMTPGWHVYVITSIGDSAYTPTSLEGFSRDEPRRLEQMILALPHAHFLHSRGGKMIPSFCLGDSLSGQQASKGSQTQPTIKLSGTPPFTVEFELRHESVREPPSASSKLFKRITRSGIKTREYKLEIPKEEFIFESRGKWLLQATKVRDGNGCESALSGVNRPVTSPPPIEIEVAETAGIAAASTRQDYCIGEMVGFTLQGTPPWTVTYDFNGKVTQASAQQVDFTRVAQEAGVLTIKSVAHQQNQCKRTIHADRAEGMVKTIHDLPNVKISEGRHYVEDLREGNQALIIFTFSGIPPFSFTYQRTEPIDTHVRPKVLETHTVTGLLEDRYSLWTSVEGTWSVTWLQDRWCQVSLDSHSGVSTLLGGSPLAIHDGLDVE